MRPLRLPSSNFSACALPSTHLESATWYRLHPAAYSPLFFSKNINHRFSHPKAPLGCLYVGQEVTTCLWERFGDRLFDERRTLPRSLWEAMVISEIAVPALDVCDFTRVATRSELSVDLSALMHTDLSVPQVWGKAIQEHPSSLLGIRYLSRFTERPCLVLFDRPGLVLESKKLCSLSHCLAAARFLDHNQVALH